MIFIIVHLRDKWNGNAVVKDAFGKAVQEPKGKETLDMLSSLFVWLEHGPGGKPSAKVLKSRIDKKVYVEDPENPPDGVPEHIVASLNGDPGIVTVPVLPLRIPKCEWPVIREYMRHPADLQNPKPGERPTDKELSEDDRLKLRAIISQNEAVVAVTEKAKLDAGEEKSKANLVKFAATLGFSAADLKDILERKGYLPNWDVDNWEKMKEALRDAKANLPEAA